MDCPAPLLDLLHFVVKTLNREGFADYLSIYTSIVANLHVTTLPHKIFRILLYFLESTL